jgi:hypothetical protein
LLKFTENYGTHFQGQAMWVWLPLWLVAVGAVEDHFRIPCTITTGKTTPDLTKNVPSCLF